MGFLKKLFLSITNSKRINKYIKPYYKLIKKDLVHFLLIDSNIPSKVDDALSALKITKSKKFNDVVKKMDELKTQISIHNNAVSCLIHIKDNDSIFNYKEIINDPYILKEEDFDNINTSINYSKTIKDLPIFPIDLSELNIIIVNYSELCKQYDLLEEFKNLKYLNNFRYIDYNDENHIKNRIKEIKNLINSKCIFYEIYNYDVDVETNVDDHNKEWIKSNLNNPIFDSINGRSLDNDQRESALTNELSTLVIAGAGSGKTLTICGKIKYLLDEEHVNPSDILLLSYSRKSAIDLQEKVNKISPLLNVGTFHKIGLEILKDTKNKSFMVEDQYNAIIEKYFREEIKNKPYMLKTILNYYGMYIGVDLKKKFKNNGEMFEDLKKQDFSTLRYQISSTSNNPFKKETIKKELVKSNQELSIANWYFINGIDYIYEAPYSVDVSTRDKRQYMPDFYLPEYKIYHEHYGINKENEALQYVGVEAENYVKNIEWKRQIHLQNQTTCLETYSWEFEDGTIFDKLEKELKSRGVKFKPLSDEEIYNAIESIYEGNSFKSFINLIKSFLNLYKARYKDDQSFTKLLDYKFNSSFEMQRAKLFLIIVEDVYHYYKNYLKNEGKIDFDDMILKSSDELDNCPHFNYKYIIVDEFQDISYSRMLFLKKLIEHGKSKLFAVGDDWQAIYRFSGCDLNIFLNFEQYFGFSKKTTITTTFRNSQELQKIAYSFITKNPEQVDKYIKSSKHLDNPIQIMYYKGEKANAFLNILDEINKINPEANVLLLGRNNFDIDSILIDKRIYIDKKESSESNIVVKVSKYSQMHFSFCTVHSSKGLEEDYVIIINADDYRLGFPNKVEDDELLNMVLSSKSEYEFAEERRLWYVALTRTKNYTYILANKDDPSVFVKEIEKDCFIMNSDIHENKEAAIYCPYCKSGKLVMRTSNNRSFLACSNYPWCTYTIDDLGFLEHRRICLRCGDFMVLRKGKFGPFYGCHSYPRCDYKEKCSDDK